MGSALSRAASELTDDLRRYNIKVYDNQLPRIIEWRGIQKKIQYGTDKRTCKRELKKFIEVAKKQRGKIDINESQEKLL